MGVILADQPINLSAWTGKNTPAYGRPPKPSLVPVTDTIIALGVGGIASDSTLAVSSKTPVNPQTSTGITSEDTGTIDWYDKFHIKRRSYRLGNVLTQQLIDLDIYSAFRRVSRNLTLFTNNAGAGVQLNALPGLPKLMAPGEEVETVLQVDIFGPPIVDSTLVFTFDPHTVTVPLVFDRIVIILPVTDTVVIPEAPYTETLEFNTNILPKPNGKEQRISLRKNPRQLFEMELILDDGQMRSYMHNSFFEWQRRDFGVPIWHDYTLTTTAVSAGAVTIPVEETDFADFRIAGLVLIIQDGLAFDIQGLASKTSGSVTLQNPIASGYPAGTIVVPVHLGRLTGPVSGSRFPNSTARSRLNIRMIDNDISIASTAAFPTFNSKVLLDACNSNLGTKGERFSQPTDILDNLTGIPYEVARTPHNFRVHELILTTHNRQATHEARQLLHSLRGRQISFYVSSFSNEMVPVVNLASGGSTISISNVGYDRFVSERIGRNVIKATFNNGLSPLIRTVTASSQTAPNIEVLTLDGTWPQEILIAEVEQIAYLEKVRFDTDAISIVHQIDAQSAQIIAPIKAVFE